MLEIVERVIAAVIILSILLLVLFVVFSKTPDCPQSNNISLDNPQTQKLDTQKSINNNKENINKNGENVNDDVWPSKDGLNIDNLIPTLIYIWFAILLLSLFLSLFGFNFSLSVPNWQILENLSNNTAFKLSSVGLVIIPLAIYVIKSNFFGEQFVFQVPLNAKLTYFSAFSFAIAAIIYGILSPNRGGLFVRWLCFSSIMYGIFFALIVLYRTSVFIYFLCIN